MVRRSARNEKAKVETGRPSAGRLFQITVARAANGASRA